MTNEPNSGQARQWFAERGDDEIVISDWTETEVSSALSIKLWSRQITDSERTDSLAGFRIMMRDSLLVVSVTRENFREAARLADQYDLGLRGGDALHLAICHGRAASLVMLDRRMHEAAQAIGISSVVM